MEQDNNWWLDLDKFNENLTQHKTPDTTWDLMFMKIAREIGQTLSKCASRQVGAILVKDKNIISIGFNGSPSGSSLCQNRTATCPRKKLGIISGKDLELCPAQHSETNCILNAAKKGISTKDSTMYIWATVSPCKSCMGAIINAGVKEIVVLDDIIWYDNLSSFLFKESKIKMKRVELKQ